MGGSVRSILGTRITGLSTTLDGCEIIGEKHGSEEESLLACELWLVRHVKRGGGRNIVLLALGDDGGA